MTRLIVILFFLIQPKLEIFSAEKAEPKVWQNELRAVVKAALGGESHVLEKLKAQRELAETDIRTVEDMKFLPEIKMNINGGIVPDARGDVFFSQDKQTDLDSWGPFVRAELTFMQPIYTFGRIDNAEDLATEGINLRDRMNEIELDKFRYIIAKSYWTVNVLKNSVKLADELESNFAKLTEEVNKEIEKEDSDLDESDLLEVKSNYFMIESVSATAKNGYQTVRMAFKEITGCDSISFDMELIPRMDTSATARQIAIETALSERSDIKALESGIKALRKKAQLAGNSTLPMIYLAGGVQYAYAPGRDDQTNPFVYDSFNYLNLGAFLGMSWNLNFLTSGDKAASDKLELKVQEENLELLKTKVKIEVIQSFNDASGIFSLITKVDESIKNAEKWLALGLDNWQMGFGDAEKLIRAYKTYYELKGRRIAMILDYHKALADLASKTTTFEKYLRWIDESEVNF